MYNIKELTYYAETLRNAQQVSSCKENRILLLTCQAPEAQPRVIGEMYTHQYEAVGSKAMPGTYVIRTYKKTELSNISARKELCTAAWHTGNRLAQAIHQGTFFSWQDALEQLPQHKEAARLLLLSTAEQAKNFWGSDLTSIIQDLNLLSAQEFSRNLTVCKQEKRIPKDSLPSASDLGQENLHLRRRLEHTQLQLQNAQTALKEQLEILAAEERREFFSQLNSTANGRILDLLVLAQQGFAQLHRKEQKIPAELRSTQTLVRSLQQFLHFYGVAPIREPGEQLTITARDLDQFLYTGTPFRSDTEVKQVEVISSGWAIPAKELVISCPEIQEIAFTSDSRAFFRTF